MILTDFKAGTIMMTDFGLWNNHSYRVCKWFDYIVSSQYSTVVRSNILIH